MTYFHYLRLLAKSNNILVHQNMIFSATLGLMLSTPSPDKGVREVVDQIFMESITEFLDCRVTFRMHNDRLVVIRDLSSRLGINANHVTLRPDSIHQLLEIPFVLAADGDIIGHLIEDVEFFDGNGVHFVEHIKNRDVCSVSLDHVDELIDCNVLSENNCGARYLILFQNASTHVRVHALGLRGKLLIINAALLPFDKFDARRLLVDPNPEAVQFRLDDFLMR